MFRRDDHAEPGEACGRVLVPVRAERGLPDYNAGHLPVLDSMVDTIAVVDQDGTILEVNRAWRQFARMNGAPALAEASVGMNYLGLCQQAAEQPSGEEAAEALAGVRAVLAGEEGEFSLQYPCHSPGEQRWFEMTVTPLIGPRRAAVITHHDITKRKAAEEALHRSEQEFRTLAEALPQMVWATRPDGWNTYFNQRWVDYTGLTMEESHGHGWSRPFHPDDRERAVDAWRHATETDGVYSIEGRLRRADGVYLWWLIRGVALRDAEGKVTKWFGTCTCIDELKAALDQADGANRAKGQFLSRMSHELRTPLNAILGLAQVMHMSADARSSAANRKHLETVLDSGWHLLRIIEDVLDLSAVEANTLDLKLETVGLRDCVAECFEPIALLAGKRQLEFRWTDDAWKGAVVRLDPARLQQVVTNLLTNAVKYNRNGGSITVSGRSAKGGVRIVVSDTGRGISESRLPSLFEPFSGLAQRPYDISGAGIGLSVARKLTEMMGGTIGVQSVLGQGSTFWIELPLVDPREAERHV